MVKKWMGLKIENETGIGEANVSNEYSSSCAMCFFKLFLAILCDVCIRLRATMN